MPLCVLRSSTGMPKDIAVVPPTRGVWHVWCNTPSRTKYPFHVRARIPLPWDTVGCRRFTSAGEESWPRPEKCCGTSRWRSVLWSTWTRLVHTHPLCFLSLSPVGWYLSVRIPKLIMRTLSFSCALASSELEVVNRCV